MPNRTTVNVSLTPELESFLQSRVASGNYQTVSEVVRETLRLLQRVEMARAATYQQLKGKLRRGAAQAEAGELLDGDEVFEELKEMIQSRKRPKKPARRV